MRTAAAKGARAHYIQIDMHILLRIAGEGKPWRYNGSRRMNSSARASSDFALAARDDDLVSVAPVLDRCAGRFADLVASTIRPGWNAFLSSVNLGRRERFATRESRGGTEPACRYSTSSRWLSSRICLRIPTSGPTPSPVPSPIRRVPAVFWPKRKRRKKAARGIRSFSSWRRPPPCSIESPIRRSSISSATPSATWRASPIFSCRPSPSRRKRS